MGWIRLSMLQTNPSALHSANGMAARSKCGVYMPPERGVGASVLATTKIGTSRDNQRRTVLSELGPTFDYCKCGTAGIAAEFSVAWLPLLSLCKPDSKEQYRGCRNMSIQREHVMRRVLRGYVKGQHGNLILIGTISAPHTKDKASPRERQDKRHLIRQGATIFKKEIVR